MSNHRHSHHPDHRSRNQAIRCVLACAGIPTRGDAVKTARGSLQSHVHVDDRPRAVEVLRRNGFAVHVEGPGAVVTWAS